VPLVFSPLTEAVLDSPPKSLFPRHAFIMRQLGEPPPLDLAMARIVVEVFEALGFRSKDADASTGGKDYLERILGLIRATGFTVAIFSHETRPTAMANIALELGFAAMSGKPILIVKSSEAAAPSDLKRTDWISYEPGSEGRFRNKLLQAIDEINRLAEWEDHLLQVALNARSIDCAVAFERANKGFLLSGERKFIEAAKIILERLREVGVDSRIDDLERLRDEISTFVRQAESCTH
jgi:hypothetical protein